MAPKAFFCTEATPIGQLAEQSDYLETCYLLLYGELPTTDQKAHFLSTVRLHTMVNEQICTFFNGFRRDAHPMAVMCGVGRRPSPPFTMIPWKYLTNITGKSPPFA